MSENTRVGEQPMSIDDWHGVPRLVDAIDRAVLDAPNDVLVDLGPAVVDTTNTAPVLHTLVVDTGDRRLGDELLSKLYLSEAAVGAEQTAVVKVAFWHENRLELHAYLGETKTGLRLFATASRRILLQALGMRVSEVNPDDGLCRDVIEGRRAESDPSASTTARLASPGVHAAVGSPEQRSAAIAQLIARHVAHGETALIVSKDNSVIDKAVVEVAERITDFNVGTIARVGLPASLEVGRDERLTVDGACRLRALPKANRMHEIEAEVARRIADPGMAAFRARVDDPSVKLPAGRTADQIVASRAALSFADRGLGKATEDAQVAADIHTTARRRHREHDEARKNFARVDELANQLIDRNADVTASATGVARLADQVRELEANGGRRSRGDIEQRLRQLVAAVGIATTRIDQRDELVSQLDSVKNEASQQGFSRPPATRAERDLQDARRVHAEAERSVLNARSDRARAAQAIERIGGAGPASIEAFEMEELTTLAGETASQIEELQAEHMELRAEVASRAREVVDASPVVVTSIGQFVANPAVWFRNYDHVILDDASSTAAAYALFAAGRATQSLVLIGSETGADLEEPEDETAATPRAPGDDATTASRSGWVEQSIMARFGLTDLSDTTQGIVQL